VSAVKEFAFKHPDLSVIYGHGWNNEVFAPEGPLKEELERNLLDIPTEEIGDVKVLMTMFEGKAVYRDSL
jgi:predicted amidohydrolase YtcJ